MTYTGQIEKFLEVNSASIVCADLLVVKEVGANVFVKKVFLPIKHTISQYNEFWQSINFSASERFYVFGVIWLNNGDWIQVYKDKMVYFSVPLLPV
jgi:hypothetical protein